MKYVYFVSFHCKQNIDSSFGSCEIKQDREIKNIEDIRGVEKLIIKNSDAKVLWLIIQNFQLLRTEE